MVLDLTNNEITSVDAVTQILITYGNAVRKLILAKNPLGNYGIEKLASALIHTRCNLDYLNIS